MPDTESYTDLKKQIDAGKVVQYKGRSAATLAELDTIHGLPDGSGALTITTYDHGKQEEFSALSAQDSIGQRAQPFSPDVVAANKPSADEPGPTTLNTTNQEVKEAAKPKEEAPAPSLPVTPVAKPK